MSISPNRKVPNVGLVFDNNPQPDGRFRMYVSGGFENKVWVLSYDPKSALPITPKNEPDKPLSAPTIDVTAAAENAPSTHYNGNVAAVYPSELGLVLTAKPFILANDLGDSAGGCFRSSRYAKIERISLSRPASAQFVYPYDLRLLTKGRNVAKVYVSLWGDASIAVVNPALKYRVTRISVDRHPTLMMFNSSQSRLYVVNSDADSVSVIDTATDRVIERIDVRRKRHGKKRR